MMCGGGSLCAHAPASVQCFSRFAMFAGVLSLALPPAPLRGRGGRATTTTTATTRMYPYNMHEKLHFCGVQQETELQITS